MSLARPCPQRNRPALRLKIALSAKLSASLLKLKLLGSESITDEGWFGAMAVIDAFLSTAFLILVAVSAAVTGSMVVLGLLDWAFGKKKEPNSALESEQADEIEEFRDGHVEQV